VGDFCILANLLKQEAGTEFVTANKMATFESQLEGKIRHFNDFIVKGRLEPLNE
jgi:hypothetical protein